MVFFRIQIFQTHTWNLQWQLMNMQWWKETATILIQKMPPSWTPAAFLRLLQKNSLIKMDLKDAILALQESYWTFSLNFLYTKMFKALKVAKVPVCISHVVYMEGQSNQKSLVTSSDSHRNAWRRSLLPDIRCLVIQIDFESAGLRSGGLGTCLALLILNLLVKHLIR